MDKVDSFNSQFVNVGISDHLPICLRLKEGAHRLDYSFKFNHSWIEDEVFTSLIKNKWLSMFQLPQYSSMQLMSFKLREIEDEVSLWERNKKLELKQELVNIEEGILIRFKNNSSWIFSQLDKDQLSLLDGRKTRILVVEEELWRLKIRVIWIS